jgi:hypothetical protein
MLKKYLPFLIYFLILTNIGCSVKDDKFLSEYRPIIVLYNEEIIKLNSYANKDANPYLAMEYFASFADRMEEIRQKGIIINPPKSKKMTEFYVKFNLLIEKSKKIGLVFSVDYMGIAEYQIYHANDKLTNEDKKWFRNECNKWLDETEILYKDFVSLNNEMSSIAKDKFRVDFQKVDIDTMYNEYKNSIKLNIK